MWKRLWSEYENSFIDEGYLYDFFFNDKTISLIFDRPFRNIAWLYFFLNTEDRMCTGAE